MDWEQKEKIKEAQTRIRNNGGKINLFQRNVIMSRTARPGLKVWAAIDCLVNYGGYFFRWEVL
ncbi:hypothetical protein KAR91_10170 [Candidatus Pacearchaeota archaeon]|nr:hypothetical protein [Candidatus Pacearchaeota archaeon]